MARVKVIQDDVKTQLRTVTNKQCWRYNSFSGKQRQRYYHLRMWVSHVVCSCKQYRQYYHFMMWVSHIVGSDRGYSLFRQILSTVLSPYYVCVTYSRFRQRVQFFQANSVNSIITLLCGCHIYQVQTEGIVCPGKWCQQYYHLIMQVSHVVCLDQGYSFKHKIISIDNVGVIWQESSSTYFMLLLLSLKVWRVVLQFLKESIHQQMESPIRQ